MPDQPTPDNPDGAPTDSRSGAPPTVGPGGDADRAPGPREGLPEELAHLGAGDLAAKMGIEILELGAQRTVGRMPVAGNTQPLGLMHGGASAVLAETLGSFAATMHAAPSRVALGLELSCTHHRAMREGFVVGIATPLSLGRNVASYAISISDEHGAPVCSARLTCLLRDA